MTGCVLAVPSPLPLAAATAPCDHRLLQTIPRATHPPADAVWREQGLVCRPRLLTATVRRMAHPCGWLPPPQGHPQGVLDHHRIALLPHGPPHHVARQHLPHDGAIPPACCGPESGDIRRPSRLRRCDITLASHQLGGNGQPRAAVRRPATPLRTPDGDACLWHPPSRLGASYRIARVLQGRRPASAPIAVAGLRVDGLHTRQSCSRRRLPPPRALLLPVEGTPPAADRQHRTHHHHGPALLVLGDTGLAHGAAFAKQRAAFCNISRAIRRRCTASRRPWRSSCAGDRGPVPGNAP